MNYRNWTTTPKMIYRAEQMAKRRAARRHYHVCQFCQDDRKYSCTDYHCKNNKKRRCTLCRRNKKYHYVDFDLFSSVATAARNLTLMKPHEPGDLLAVHMESTYEFGSIVHKYFAHWKDGSKTEMNEWEISQWAIAGSQNLSQNLLAEGVQFHNLITPSN